MFQRKEPKKVAEGHMPKQFPHCDSRILHAPGECQYCDHLPIWQALRQAWGIAFTNYQPEGNELPCPAMLARGDSVNKWHGNIAQPKKEETRPSEVDAEFSSKVRLDSLASALSNDLGAAEMLSGPVLDAYRVIRKELERRYKA
jgi:hypothetical protein